MESAKVIDLEIYRQTKNKVEAQPETIELLPLDCGTNEEANDFNLPIYPESWQQIIDPYTYSKTYILPEKFIKRWNKFWAVGFTVGFIIMMLF